MMQLEFLKKVLVKIMVSIGSSVSIGFGIWHFFVPRAWKWYAYIDPNARELIVAVRAINVFFSLSLVLFGLLNLLFVYGNQSNRYSMIVLLAATSVLWLTRVLFQVIYPQGSINPVLQYGMMAAFILVSLCYIVSLVISLLEKNTI
ncbi:MAG: hypothetical protein AB9897_01665 [Anaerolineaceae bacterium]